MQRAELEHLIRAAASIADDPDIVVVGSQSILGSFPIAPAALLRSVEADVFPRNEPGRAVIIDGAIGEGSPFHESFGYYAHGVGPETSIVSEGWEARLVPLRNENTRGATGWCLDPHDAVVAKLAAGREHDVAFATEALRAGLVDQPTLAQRISALPIDDDRRAYAMSLLTLAAAHAARPPR